ncbi:MAG: iron chelate uptake ABC transporter family permease subunit [Sumerlaeia bacterium]
MTPEELFRTLLLQDYNTRVVVIGSILLGISSGLVGTSLFLRKRALLSDTLSHATLPGIAVAYLALVAAGQGARNLLVLLLGAAAASVIAVLTIGVLKRTTRLKDDALLSIVMSVFFGLGISLLGIISRNAPSQSAGLEKFIYGSTASMIASDAILMGGVALAVSLIMIVLWKEFQLFSFDSGFAASEGYSVFWIDLLMMTLVVAVTVTGLQAVGLILVVALLVIPPVSARFWTHDYKRLLYISALFGGISAAIGALLSAFLTDVPAGAVIVLVATAIFILSLLFGPAKGIVFQLILSKRLEYQMGQQHLLRAVYELQENQTPLQLQPTEEHLNIPVPQEALLSCRAWSPKHLNRLVNREERNGKLLENPNGITLTQTGLREAKRLVRSHRLWELYLITYADVAPSHVDRSADDIEHVLDAKLVARLEEKLLQLDSAPPVPRSPHPLVELHVEPLANEPQSTSEPEARP